jgi:hypothetical protein
VYLAKLPGFAKKVRVAIQWTLDLLFSRQIEQFLTLKDLEQIEQLAAQLRASRAEASTHVTMTTDESTYAESIPRRKLLLQMSAKVAAKTGASI